MFKRILASLLVAVMLVNESSVLVAAETNDTSGKNVEVVWSEPTLITEEEEQVIATESIEVETVVEETVEATETETIEVIETEITEVVETPVTEVVEEVKYNDVSTAADFVITNNVVEEYIGTATEVVIPDGVTQIAVRAFESMDFITSVTIPESVASVGQYAFSGCTSLTTVQLPSGLKELAPGVFSGCTNLTSVQLPSGLTMIDMAAFSGCTQLTGVTLPDTLIVLEENAFYNCTSLTSIVIPDSVTSVATSAFSGCTALVEIEFPSNWNLIRYTMTGANHVKKVVIREGATSVPPEMFKDNTVLTEVVLPNSITTFEVSAFSGCTSLQKLVVPDNLQVVGASALFNCTSLYHIVVAADPTLVNTIRTASYYPISKVEFKEGTTTIPQGILANGNASDGFYGEYEQENPALGVYTVVMPDTVTTVDRYAFSKARNLTTVVWSENLKTIGEHAFDECAVKVLTLPESLEEIGDYAFWDSAVTNAIMPNNIVTIGNYAFQYCEELAELVLSKSVEHIGDYAFGNTGITHIEIPASLESIGHMYDGGSLFANCSNLKSASLEYGAKRVLAYLFRGTPIETISIPASVTVIEGSAFAGCTNLREVIMPSSVREVGGGAFSNCTSLVNVELSKNLERMQDGSFEYCTALESIHIPKRLCNTASSMGNPFYGCTNLKTFTFASGVTQIPGTGLFAGTGIESIELPETITSIGDQAFWDCTELTSIVIPDGVHTIGRSAFAGCSKLKNITLPSALTYLDERVFYNSGLESIVIPEGITMLAGEMFLDCKKLASVTLPEGIESIGTSAFANCDKLTSIKIPNSVMYINYEAFYECDGLADVEFGAGLKRIEDRAFSGCLALTSAYIPRATEYIGRDAFAYCMLLEEVFIPQDVTYIDEYAFIASDNITIYGVSGSYAEEYANEWEIPFEERRVAPESVTFATDIYIPFVENEWNPPKIIAAVVTPNYYTEGTLEWSSSNTGVVGISTNDSYPNTTNPMWLYPNWHGVAEITATMGDLSGSCKVTVGNPIPVTSLSLSKTEVEIDLGYSMSECVYMSATPADTNQLNTVLVSSSDEEVVHAYLSVGIEGPQVHLDARKPGTAVITVTSGEVSASCQVTVVKKANMVYIQNVMTNSIEVGSTVHMDGYVSPGDTTDEIIWSTSDPTIATVEPDEGNILGATVTGIAPGTATITLSAGNQSGTYDVTVYPKTVPVTGVTLNMTEHTMRVSDRHLTLTATVTPEDTTEQVYWMSSDATVASVTPSVDNPNEATVEVYNEGSVQITIYAGMYSASCTVYVLKDEKPATGISLSQTTLSMDLYESSDISAYVTPMDTTDEIIWTSSSPDVANVMDKGMGNGEAEIIAYGVGTATITATAGAHSARCLVTVTNPGGSEIPATGVSLSLDSITMNPMETYTLTANVEPGNTTDSFMWESSDPMVASVMQGAFPNEAHVYAYSAGTAVITVTVGACRAECVVTVNETAGGEGTVEGVDLSHNWLDMYTNGSAMLTAYVRPSDATESVSWWSDNPTVADVTVDPANDRNATVYAYNPGMANITVTAGMYMATCTVNVTDQSVAVTGLTLSQDALTMSSMDVSRIYAYLEPTGAMGMVNWQSSNANVASVMAYGNEADIYAYNPGVAVITATIDGHVATCIVTVTENGPETIPAMGVSLSATEHTMEIYSLYTLNAIVMPENTTDMVTWTSSDENVARVYMGAVSTEASVNSVGAGTATITVTVGNYSASCVITVYDPYGPAESVTLDKTSATMELYSMYHLYAAIEPINTNDEVIWTSSDESVAVVHMGEFRHIGVVNSMGVGTATITVTVGAYSASCEITVVNTSPTPGPGPDMSEQERQVRAFVERMYTIVLDRPADPNGLSDWAAGLIEQRVDGAQVVNGFVGSAEFAARGLTDLQFIETLYLAVLNREADDFGISEWMRAFAQGATRQDLIDGFVSSAEFHSLCESYGILAIITQEHMVRNFASRMYTVALNRPADEAGLTYWVSKLISGQADGAALADGFINSPEFAARNLSDADYIRTLYLTLLNREADDNGLNDWLRAFSLGTTRQQMLDGFIASAEFRALCESFGISAKLTQEDRVRNFVSRMYTVALGRGYDEAGLNDWVRGLIDGVIKGAEVAEGFIMSAEFEARGLSNESYVQTLYQTFFNREASADDVNGWVAAMTVYGQSRREVLKGFVNSAEFAALCENYGIIRGEMR